jgi:hypothetical protein
MDSETCPACGGAVRIIARIEDPVVIQNDPRPPEDKNETCRPFPLPESRAPPGTLFG